MREKAKRTREAEKKGRRIFPWTPGNGEYSHGFQGMEENIPMDSRVRVPAARLPAWLPGGRPARTGTPPCGAQPASGAGALRNVFNML
eukprot:9426304-Pyramimonas_sp.AAC.1